MLNTEVVDALQAPISEASPCGDDLEYDAAFTALETAAQGKPEQQFGTTVIPAVDPEWRVVAEQAQALLGRSKDIRIAVLLLRATTRQQGVMGFSFGLDLLHGLLERYWDGIHPKPDADEADDPTIRLNALAPLSEDDMVLRDLNDASLGLSRGVGLIKVRDVVLAYAATGSAGGDGSYTQSQIDGALTELQAETPELLQTLIQLAGKVARLQTLLNDRTGRVGSADLSGLRSITTVLNKACSAVVGSSSEDDAQAGEAVSADGSAAPSRAGSAPGEIRTRQDAVQTLDRVIRYLETAEPGNPAPLLIARAKKLIGVSFFEIMADLAPNALDTIETVTGKQPVE